MGKDPTSLRALAQQRNSVVKIAQERQSDGVFADHTLGLLAVQSAAHDINILCDAVGQGAAGRRITTLRTGEVVDE